MGSQFGDGILVERVEAGTVDPRTAPLEIQLLKHVERAALLGGAAERLVRVVDAVGLRPAAGAALKHDGVAVVAGRNNLVLARPDQAVERQHLGDQRPEPSAWGERLPFNTVCGEFTNASGGWVHAVAFSPSGAALAYAVGAILSRRFHFTRDPFVVTTWQIGTAAVCNTTLAVGTGSGPKPGAVGGSG